MVRSAVAAPDYDVDKFVAMLERLAKSDPVWAARCAEDAAVGAQDRPYVRDTTWADDLRAAIETAFRARDETGTDR